MRKKKALKILAVLILALIVVGGTAGTAFRLGFTRGKADREGEIWEEIHGGFGPDLTDFWLFLEAWSLLKANYLGELPSDQELAWAAIRGMVDSLDDPYTAFGSVEERIEYWKDYSPSPIMGSYGGIGVMAQYRERGARITEVLENSPAEVAGLREGDLIVRALKGRCAGFHKLSLYERSVLLKGLPGTEVWLEVERVGASQSLLLKVERTLIEDVELSPAYGYFLPGKVGYSEKIGYLRLHELGAFNVETYRLFREFLKALLSQGAEVLVLDLRDNPGGSVLNTVLVADELFPQGEIIAKLARKGDTGKDLVIAQEDRVLLAQALVLLGGGLFETGGLAPEMPLVVLVNGNTVSGAEMLAGAIQDHERGVLVGETTFGKGVGSGWHELPDGSGLYIRDSYWETPLGRNVDGVGITPDIVIPMPGESDGTDPQLEKALECALALLEGKECR